jgi:hypothetical protein
MFEQGLHMDSIHFMFDGQLLKVEIARCLKWLLANEQVSTRMSVCTDAETKKDFEARTWHITPAGLQFLRDTLKRPEVNNQLSKWVNEVRAGIATEPGKLGTVTKETEVQNAAIPSTPKHTPKGPTWQPGELGYLAKLAGMTVSELIEALQENTVKLCGKCSEIKKLNKFPRDRQKSDGRHTYCKTCHKKARRKDT